MEIKLPVLLEQNNYYTIQYKDVMGTKQWTISKGMGLTMMKELVRNIKGVMTLQTNNGYDVLYPYPKTGGQP